jgi:hypothetical protein
MAMQACACQPSLQPRWGLMCMQGGDAHGVEKDAMTAAPELQSELLQPANPAPATQGLRPLPAGMCAAGQLRGPSASCPQLDEAADGRLTLPTPPAKCHHSTCEAPTMPHSTHGPGWAAHAFLSPFHQQQQLQQQRQHTAQQQLVQQPAAAAAAPPIAAAVADAAAAAAVPPWGIPFMSALQPPAVYRGFGHRLPVLLPPAGSSAPVLAAAQQLLDGVPLARLPQVCQPPACCTLAAVLQCIACFGPVTKCTVWLLAWTCWYTAAWSVALRCCLPRLPSNALQCSDVQNSACSKTVVPTVSQGSGQLPATSGAALTARLLPAVLRRA